MMAIEKDMDQRAGPSIPLCDYDIYRPGPMAYIRDRSRPTTGLVKSLRYNKNTRSCIMTSTGYYRLLYNQDRPLLTTLYEFYPVGSSPSEYTKNTRLCIMTSTGHDRLLYNQDRSLPTTLYVFYPGVKSSRGTFDYSSVYSGSHSSRV